MISANSTNPWIIIGFANFAYIEVAKIWYNQLTALGYTEHKIGVLDHETFYELTFHGYRTILPDEKLLKKMSDVKLADKPITRLIWTVRLSAMKDLIIKGFNVMISDVDSIWIKYQNLNLLPTGFDSFHAYGTTFPQSVFDEQGFVVCGGVAAYKSTENTKRFFSRLVEECGSKCDDQMLINGLLIGEWNMDWQMSPGTGVRFGTSRNVTDSGGKAFSSLIFNEEYVIRGRDRVEVCKGDDSKAWIISPKAKKDGEMKLKLFETYKPCFKDGILDGV